MDALRAFFAANGLNNAPLGAEDQFFFFFSSAKYEIIMLAMIRALPTMPRILPEADIPPGEKIQKRISMAAMAAKYHLFVDFHG